MKFIALIFLLFLVSCVPSDRINLSKSEKIGPGKAKLYMINVNTQQIDTIKVNCTINWTKRSGFWVHYKSADGKDSAIVIYPKEQFKVVWENLYYVH